MRRRIFVATVAAVVLTGFSPGASALPLHLVGYDFDLPTGIGEIQGIETAYSDPNRTKLTDGKTGGDDWTADHEPWVGWYGIGPSGSGYSPVDVVIDFTFGGMGTVDSLVVGTNQDAVTNWNVVLPSYVGLYLVDKDGAETLRASVQTPFSVGPSGDSAPKNVGRRHEINMSFSPVEFDTGGTLRLKLNNEANFALVDNTNSDLPQWNNTDGSEYNGLFWVFVDEVSFGTTPVPEPSTVVLLGTGLVVVAARRRGSS